MGSSFIPSSDLKHPDDATNVSYFNAQGELWKRADADGNITLATNLNCNDSYSVVDLDRDSQIDWSGPDRIIKSVSDVTSGSLMGGNMQMLRAALRAPRLRGSGVFVSRVTVKSYELGQRR